MELTDKGKMIMCNMVIHYYVFSLSLSFLEENIYKITFLYSVFILSTNWKEIKKEVIK